MKVRKGQIEIILIGILLSLLIVGIVFLKLPFLILSVTILALGLVLITFLYTDLALIILIFSMLLSPELKLAEVPARAVVVRIDDILLIVVFFTWLAKMAINKELGLFRRTPINGLIVTYIFICIISTIIGILTGGVHPLKSFFYILKYVEYFMLYFLVTNNIRDKRQIKVFLVVFLITCAITCTYALATIEKMGGRATAPFEGPKGEPNTLGGYLVLLFAISTGIFLYSSLRGWRIFCGILACLIFITLLQTLSRGSYLAFIITYLVLTVLTKKKKLLLIGILLLGMCTFPFILPEKVIERIGYTFTPRKPRVSLHGRSIPLEESAYARIETWKRVFREWKRRPLLGRGVTGLGLVDAQYPRVLGETGILGFSIFMWLLIYIFRYSLSIFRAVEDEWLKGLTLGFLSGFVGLLFHSFAAATFIIVRIMEPFWFLAGVILMLPSVEGISV